MRVFVQVLLLCLFFPGSGCARKLKPAVAKTVYAFYEQRHVGNLPVDENGNPAGPGSYIIYILYVETGINELPPVVRNVTRLGMQHDAAGAEACSPGAVSVGKEAETGKAISIKASKGCKLWRIETTAGTPLPPGTLKAGNDLRVAGSFNGKATTITLSLVRQLETMPRY